MPFSVLLKRQSKGRLRLVIGRGQLSRWMPMSRFAGDIEDWRGAGEIVGGV